MANDINDIKDVNIGAMSTKTVNTLDLVMQVDADDLDRARTIISTAIQDAKAAWIPGHLVAGALYLELLNTLVENKTSGDNQAAEFLEAITRNISECSLDEPNIH